MDIIIFSRLAWSITLTRCEVFAVLVRVPCLFKVVTYSGFAEAFYLAKYIVRSFWHRGDRRELIQRISVSALWVWMR